ncbi:MAG: aminopeptidase P family N-terminal domain-containing protein, partial [Rhizobiaceae bacterium]
PSQGLRANLEIDELARFEFAACHTSEAVKRVIFGARPGMSEFEAASLLQPIGLPLSCHTMMSSGERAWHGLLSPTSRTLEQGDAVTTAYGVQGALNCRAGWLVSDAGDLLKPIQDYIDVLVAPYFEAVAYWLETVGIGVEGGELYEGISMRIGDPFFGVGLNPGHLIHLDEWMNSPIYKNSKHVLRSGMALQVDVIPATGGPYFTTNMEDGIILLDERGRAEIGEKYPDITKRFAARRAFMAEELGIHLKPEVLPMSNLASFLPPFWLEPGKAMVLE